MANADRIKSFQLEKKITFLGTRKKAVRIIASQPNFDIGYISKNGKKKFIYFSLYQKITFLFIYRALGFIIYIFHNDYKKTITF